MPNRIACVEPRRRLAGFWHVLRQRTIPGIARPAQATDCSAIAAGRGNLASQGSQAVSRGCTDEGTGYNSILQAGGQTYGAWTPACTCLHRVALSPSREAEECRPVCHVNGWGLTPSPVPQVG